MKVTHVEIELLTEEAFRPFGELLCAKARSPDFHGIGTDGWVIDLQLAGRIQIMTLRSRYQGLRFSKLERHFHVTQAFIPTGGSPSVVALAPPADAAKSQSTPKPDQVRAFLIDGTKGYVMKRGTWHSLDRYPLYPPASEFVVITDQETTDELTHVARENWQLTQEVDYAERSKVLFELVPGYQGPAHPV